VATPSKWSKNSPFQSFLLIGLFFFFASHLLLLTPSSLEEDFGTMRILKPKDLLSFLKNEPESRFDRAFIRDTPPSYALRDSILYSTEGGDPKLKLTSRKSNIYQLEQVSHIRNAKAEVGGRATVEAKEALYDMTKASITFLGDVHCTFEGGAEVDSDTAVMDLKPVIRIRIPVTEQVRGRKMNLSSPVTFTALGLEYSDDSPKILRLLKSVDVRVHSDRELRILSDQATFLPDDGLLHFFMNDDQIIERQFVLAKEPELDLKSRTLDLRLAQGKELEEATALQDVWFQDRQNSGKMTEGTGGKAVYRPGTNVIHLSDFPQLYQDRDTVTGDSITYHRNTDEVEVSQSNAIYKNEPKSPTR
jgi:lipopolysaccharide transport protein LptA